MICNKINLSEEVFFSTYLIENSAELQPGTKRPMVIICPGGGYAFTSDREAEPVALQFTAKGMHSVVLRYSVGMAAAMPQPLKELAEAVAYVRDHSEEWFVDSNQIYVCGFSAGGHLAASLGVFWNNEEVLPEYKEDFNKIKPNGLLLGYPVIDLFSSTKRLDIGIVGEPEYDTISFGQVHPNMPKEQIFVRENGKTYVDFEVAMNAYIFHGPYTKEQEEFYSLQNQVTEHTPPTFLWHGAQDDLIYPANSLKFATALSTHQVPFELHIFQGGGHGLGLANSFTSNHPWELQPQCEVWMDLAITWMRSQGACE